MAVECRWMHLDRKRGEGRGKGESMGDLGKRRRGTGRVGEDRFKLVSLFEIILFLLFLIVV